MIDKAANGRVEIQKIERGGHSALWFSALHVMSLLNILEWASDSFESRDGGDGLACPWVPYPIVLAVKTLHAGAVPGFGESLRES
jgi:hypothetical protein